MVETEQAIFRIRSKRLYLHLLMLLLIVPVIAFCLFMAATAGKSYPDLSVTPIIFTCMGFIWIGLFAEYPRQTIWVQTGEENFIIKKFGQKPKRFSYHSILSYNERQEVDRSGTFNTLTVYLNGDYFMIKSNDFDQYASLKTYFTQYGQSVAYQKVITKTERNRLRWMIVGLALLITGNIAFGYLAHDATDKNPSPLVAITDYVSQVRDDRPRGTLHGVAIALRSYPTFTFYVSRRNYEARLDTLRWQIKQQQLITLHIRESEFRKKLQKTEPLTFGDKFVGYNQIMVFDLKQGSQLQLTTSRPIFEPTHTNPTQRTILLSVLFIVLLVRLGLS